MDAMILTRIRQSNPWLFGDQRVGIRGVSAAPLAWVERRQFSAGAMLSSGRAHLVVGPRQSGKSSLVWSLLRDLRTPLYINAEEPLFRQWAQSPTGVLEDIRTLATKLDALFLEEAQWIPSAGLFVKGLVDLKPDFPIVVTGSSSFHLGDRIRESLAGRATRHTLLPFSLKEVCPASSGEAPAVLEAHRRDALSRLLRSGGYPEVWTSGRPGDVLGNLLQGLILRDATDLLAVERPDAFVRILRLAAGQVGNLVNATEYASLCGVSATTVQKYLSIMQDMHVLYLVPPFSGGRRRELTGTYKVFFVDNGLRNALLSRLEEDLSDSPDRGPLLENWVFSELLKAFPWPSPVRYWRSQSRAEVDFVLESAKRLLGIEVKSASMTRPVLLRSSRSFVEAYSPREFWVLNESLSAKDTTGVTQLRWIPFHRLPEELDRVSQEE
jgi:hypothetical protein